MAGRPFRGSTFWKAAGLVAGGLALAGLAGCNELTAPKASKPVPYALVSSMQKSGMKETSQIFIRIFKESSELEVWKQTQGGTFALLKTYDICKWSGVLGPKKKEGDRQAPEGFYTVTPGQMNPKSSYYLSFNIGYPNRFDQSLGRTGSNLMVHGACSSAGCYSMNDENAGELFALARDSFRGGQTNFQIQAFPFRMTPENLARHRDDPNMPFWKMLKVGYDHFEVTKRPPRVDVCDRSYVFDADAGGASFNASASCPAYTVDPTLMAAVERKQAADDAAMTVAIADIEAKKLAEDQAAQMAAVAAAEREQRAALREADRAANPSIVTKLLDRIGIGGDDGEPLPDPQPVASVVPAPPAAASPQPPADAMAAVPLPRERPAAAAAAAVAAPAPVAAPVPAPAVAAAEPAPASGGIGTFIKKKFLWPGEEDPAAEGAPPG